MKKRVPDYLNDHLDDYHFEGRFQIYNDEEDLYGDNATEIYVDEGFYVTRLKQTELYNLDHGVGLSGFNEYSGYSHLGDVNFFIEEVSILSFLRLKSLYTMVGFSNIEPSDLAKGCLDDLKTTHEDQKN